MRSAPRALFAGLIAPLAVSVAACGSSSGLLSGQQASSLRAGLDQINNALNQHDCSAAQSETVTLKSRVENLPSSVNGTVRSSLTQAANKLEALVSRDCAPVSTNTQPQTTPTHHDHHNDHLDHPTSPEKETQTAHHACNDPHADGYYYNRDDAWLGQREGQWQGRRKRQRTGRRRPDHVDYAHHARQPMTALNPQIGQQRKI